MGAFFATGGDESRALMFFPHPGLQLFLVFRTPP